jgi:hypothetical protein
MADIETLKQRLAALEARIRKAEAHAHPVAPSDHDVSSLLQDLWGEHARVQQYLSGREVPDVEGGVKVTSPSQAYESMNEMEKKLAQAESLRAGR